MTPRRYPPGWRQDVLGPDFRALDLNLAADDEGDVVEGARGTVMRPMTGTFPSFEILSFFR